MKKIGLLVLLITCACSNPFVSKEVIDELEAKRNPLISNVGVIYNNDIYYFPDFRKEPVKITNTPTETKTQIRVNFSGTKIAYLNSAGNPVVIDMGGNIDTVLTQYAGADKIDWTFDDKTLYIVANNGLYFYGPRPDIPALTFNDAVPNQYYHYRLLNATISRYNDVAYVYEHYNFYRGEIKSLVYKAKGTSEEIPIDVEYDYHDFKVFTYNTDDDLVVGSNYYDWSPTVDQIEVFSYKSSYARETFESSESYTTPIYKASLVCMLGGYSSGWESYFLCARRYGYNNIPDTEYPAFNSATTQMYTDWKQ